MPQNTANRKGYMAFSLKLSTTAARLIDLVTTQLGITLAGSYREVQIQIDPETSAALSVRIGDGSLGTTSGAPASVLQKGVTLVGTSAGPQDIFRCSGADAIYANMMYLQAVSGTPVVNVQFFEV
jgi:hypothetical protein